MRGANIEEVLISPDTLEVLQMPRNVKVVNLKCVQRRLKVGWAAAAQTCFSGVTRTLELGLKHIVQAFAAVSATFRCVYTFGKVDMAALWLSF